MQIIDVKSEGLKQQFTVTIPHAHYNEILKEQILKAGRTTKVAGFRPGKVPFAMLEQRYKASAHFDAMDQCYQQAVQHLINTKKLKPALRPEIDPAEFQEGQDLKINISVEMLPEIKMVDIKSLKFDVTTSDVTPEQIAEHHNHIRNINHVPGDAVDRAAENGDIVIIDFVGRLKNGKLFNGGQAEDTPLKLGSATFIPGFEDQLIGVKKGEAKDVHVTFPTAYHEKSLAGQEVVFHVTVKEVCLSQMADLDDKLANMVGFDSLEKLNEAIHERIGGESDRMSLLISKRRILDYFADHYKFDVPEGLVNLEYNTISEQYNQQMGKQLHDDEKQQYHDIAERRVRLGLLLADIGRQYEVQVSQNELEAAVMQVVRRYPGQAKQIFEYYRTNRDALAGLKAPIFEDKVVKLILDKAQITTKKVTFTELEQLVKELTEGDDDEMLSVNAAVHDNDHGHEHVHGPNCNHDH